MRPGLSFRETMRGRYWRLDAPTEERALSLSLEARAADLRRFARDRTLTLRGAIEAEGLATGREVDGTLVVSLLQDRRLPYRLRFRGDDGRRYELSGQKEWMGVAPVASLTTLPVSLYDEAGEEIARGTLSFDLRTDGGKWLRSFRAHLLS